MSSLKSLDKQLLLKKLLILYAEKIKRCREDFFYFCKTIQSTDNYYNDGKPHLKKLCNVLQALYEGKLKNSNGEVLKRLIIQMPPRHGKSRTLVNFCSWVLGLSLVNRVITFSHTDDLAIDFSKYTRDIISMEKNRESSIVPSDVFGYKLKKGDASKKQWALEGSHFNYKGVGREGSITGKGGNIAIYDDIVKGDAEAVSKITLDKIWNWYVATARRRLEEGGLEILCGTPWAKDDITGRLLQTDFKDDYYFFSLDVATNLKYENNKLVSADMLSNSDMSFKTYKIEREIAFLNPVTKSIFLANYHNERIDIEGLLYGEFKEWETLPEKYERIYFYCDTADTGTNYLGCIGGIISGGYCYVTGIYYTQKSMEVTEDEVVDFLIENSAKELDVEGNNGGRGFARNIAKKFKERNYNIAIDTPFQSGNKQTRILINSANVNKYIIMPKNWKTLYPEAANSITTYSRIGKNLFDDIEDAMTGLVERKERGRKHISYNEIESIQTNRKGIKL